MNEQHPPMNGQHPPIFLKGTKISWKVLYITSVSTRGWLLPKDSVQEEYTKLLRQLLKIHFHNFEACLHQMKTYIVCMKRKHIILLDFLLNVKQ